MLNRRKHAINAYQSRKGWERMIGYYRRWKKKRAIQKVKPGDGHELKRYRWWHIFTRSLFFIKLPDKDGSINIYAVDVHYFSEENNANLYRNGKHYASSKLPATFPVADGVIEVATTIYGLKRMHYVKDENIEEQLSPHPRSMEGLRMKFGMRFPRMSKVIGNLAIIVLITSLILGLPQLVTLIFHIPFVSERWGTFESPFILPNWLNVTLLVSGTLALIERTITLRNHWLIDMETWWEDLF